ncbi:hypothetical protein CANINC_004344 [Pichia inconspicua]|uniref:Proteasome subunit alpha type n=1 Tax=Pichia inconspicua TaxID=52247 RepID=A0A4T0WWH6_9ASCO|nr:hypothetical protein CANINC_004344 [[Candida] inconspicua]
MSRRYDSRTTIFSPEGRLYQVEYALEAINHAGTVIGILSNNGIVLLAERKTSNKLLDTNPSNSTINEKIYQINDSTITAVAGLNSDASILINYIRIASQDYLKLYNSQPPLSYLVKRIADLKQGYTQYGGLRPFGVSFLFAGYDEINGLQLYSTNPSGNYSGWLATSIGSNNSNCQSLLKKHYNDSLSLQNAIDLALNVLKKSSDLSKLNSTNLELSVVSIVDDTPSIKLYSPSQIDSLLENLSPLE